METRQRIRKSLNVAAFLCPPGGTIQASRSGRTAQDCPACPPGLAGGPATYLGTFRPTALISPAGRCGGFTRRAVCPSKPLKTRQRYPRRARSFCAIEYPRTESGQPSLLARAAARSLHYALGKRERNSLRSPCRDSSRGSP